MKTDNLGVPTAAAAAGLLVVTLDITQESEERQRVPLL